MRLNWLFIASAGLLVVNSAITLYDWLHGGVMWPWLIVGRALGLPLGDRPGGGGAAVGPSINSGCDVAVRLLHERGNVSNEF